MKIENVIYIVPPDFNDNIALLYSSCDHCIHPEDGLTRRGRNIHTFVYTLTTCMLHEYSCVFDCRIYTYWSTQSKARSSPRAI